MEDNWREKNDRDNLVTNVEIRGNDTDRLDLVLERLEHLEVENRRSVSWTSVAIGAGAVAVSLLIGFLSINYIQIVERNIREEMRYRTADLEKQIDDYNRQTVAAISRIDNILRSDDRVFIIQLMLKSLNYKVESTGVDDDQTKEAIRNFQRDQGLTVDGLAGRIVERALKEALRRPR